MNWSAEQQRLLRALGHDLMVHGQAWPPARAPEAVPAAQAASPRPARNAPAAPAASPAASGVAGADTGGARLLEALRRAAGGGDISALIEDMERLRREPALKRALWPRLRAIRRSH